MKKEFSQFKFKEEQYSYCSSIKDDRYKNSNWNNNLEDNQKELLSENNQWIYYKRPFRPNYQIYDDEYNQFLDEHYKKLSEFKDEEAFKKLMSTPIYIFDKNKKNVKEKIIICEKFEELDLYDQLQKNLKSLKFDHMTPIQKTVIPLITKNVNVIGCAQTGSGKTMAFLLPIIDNIIKKGVPNYDPECLALCKPIVLILSPTRELTEQTYKVSRLICKNTGLNCAKLYGGAPHIDQINEMKPGAEILIATPGRLLDFLKKGTIALNYIKYLILDEADRMLDMGFEKQICEIVFRHKMPVKEERQSLLFSATFSDEVCNSANAYIKDYFIISNNINFEEVRANENIEQKFYEVEENKKMYKLHECLQKVNGSTIVFVERKYEVDSLTHALQTAKYNCIGIHGDKSQDERNFCIEEFNKGKIPLLIATDVVGRGIDFPNVKFIFNYDCPKNVDDYIHRIGRTGRCGKKGVSITFINWDNIGFVRQVVKLLNKQKIEIPQFMSDMLNNNYNNIGFNSGTGFGSGYSKGFGNDKDKLGFSVGFEGKKKW